MSKTVLLAITALVAFSVGGAPAASSRPATSSRPHILYDQFTSDSLVPVVSQNFDTGHSFYDANGADDFPSLGQARVSEVVANGNYYSGGSGPADSFDVIFYKKIKIGEKTVVRVQATCLQQAYIDPNGFGLPDIKLHGCTGELTFPNGGWISVIANMSLAKGLWDWNTIVPYAGSQAVYRTPNDQTRCPTYTYITQCPLLDGVGNDLGFELLGYP